MKISILGTLYEIIRKDYKDEPDFEKRNIDGYCDGCLKKIVIGNLKTFPDFEKEEEEWIKQAEQHTLRHEIVHAFFNESGLCESSLGVSGGWAKNEEMVDWIALQGKKIYMAWRLAGAL